MMTALYIFAILALVYFAAGVFLTWLFRVVNTRHGRYFKDYLVYPFTLPVIVIINIFRKEDNDS